MKNKKKPAEAPGKRPATRSAVERAGLRVWRWQLPLIALVALACYIQTAGYGFVYDDNVQIVQNPRIRSFSNVGAAFNENFWAFSTPGLFNNYYRPLQTVTYMAGYALSGLEPSAYHWISIILHVLASAAVYLLGLLLLPAAGAALGGALLFASHPMHTETVSWIAGVTDLGCGLFYFLAIGCYLKGRLDSSRRVLWLAAAGMSFLAALLFKEMALTLPVVVLLVEAAADGPVAGAALRARLARLLPLLGVLGLYVVLRIHALGAFARSAFDVPIGLPDRFLTVLYLTGRYLQDLVLPVAHNAYHVFRPVSAMPYRSWLLPFVFVALCVLSIWLLRRERRILLLLLAGLVCLAPVMNIGGTGQNVYAERYLYIPSALICLVAAAVAARCLKNPRVAGGALTVAVVALSYLTIVRNPVWRDNRSFYAATLEVSPDAALIHNNLGSVLFAAQDHAAALRHFSAALEADERAFVRSPRDRSASLLGLSAVANAKGAYDEARRLAEEARRTAPHLAGPYETLGMLAGRRGKLDEAEALLRRALEIQPSNAAARVNLGNIYLLRQLPAAAEAEFRRAIDADPTSPGAHLSLGYLLLQGGRRDESIRAFEKALDLSPGSSAALQALERAGTAR